MDETDYASMSKEFQAMFHVEPKAPGAPDMHLAALETLSVALQSERAKVAALESSLAQARAENVGLTKQLDETRKSHDAQNEQLQSARREAEMERRRADGERQRAEELQTARTASMTKEYRELIVAQHQSIEKLQSTVQSAVNRPQPVFKPEPVPQKAPPAYELTLVKDDMGITRRILMNPVKQLKDSKL